MTSASFAGHAFKKSRLRTATDRLSVVLLPYRVVNCFLVASLLWKLKFFPAIVSEYLELKLSDHFFPALFSSPIVLIVLFVIPVTSGLVALFVRNKLVLRSLAITTMICLFGLCIHQGSYNDVTFVTCFWVSAWCVWYSFRLDDPAEILLSKARMFGLLIISLIFLGGAIGKWTPGYWSGEVIYEIYFVRRDFWLFNLLRANFEADAPRDLATYYSRMIIASESACAFLWLLNPKIGSAIAVMMLFGITLFSNVLLFSVTLCLIGLAIVGLHEPGTKPASE